MDNGKCLVAHYPGSRSLADGRPRLIKISFLPSFSLFYYFVLFVLYAGSLFLTLFRFFEMAGKRRLPVILCLCSLLSTLLDVPICLLGALHITADPRRLLHSGYMPDRQSYYYLKAPLRFSTGQLPEIESRHRQEISRALLARSAVQTSQKYLY